MSENLLSIRFKNTDPNKQVEQYVSGDHIDYCPYDFIISLTCNLDLLDYVYSHIKGIPKGKYCINFLGIKFYSRSEKTFTWFGDDAKSIYCYLMMHQPLENLL